jgi:hypothetical protein
MTVFDLTHSAADAATAADADPFVARVKNYGDTVLRPTALETDRRSVDSGRIAEFGELGLLNYLAPVEFGGAAISRDADRRLHEIIAGGCFNTWLVWAQHAPLAGRLADVLKTGGVLPEIGYDVLRGRLLLGAGVSDVRRFPDRYIAATRAPGGWTFSGTISWVSGWGLNAVLTVSAVDSSTHTVVTALVPVGDRTRSTRLDLSAMSGSRTERVTLADVFVPDENVISTESLSNWRTNDLGTASDARPHHFGLAQTVLDELDTVEHPTARQVAELWRPRVGQLRSDAYSLADAAKADGDGRHRINERLAVKVATGEALATLTRTLVIARAGHGIDSGDTAQLHARSAMFVLVQGQTSEVRDAQLSHLAR